MSSASNYDALLGQPYVHHGDTQIAAGTVGIDVGNYSVDPTHPDGKVTFKSLAEFEETKRLLDKKGETESLAYGFVCANIKVINRAQDMLGQFSDRFDALVPSEPLVPKRFLHRWLNGRVNPEVDKDDLHFRYEVDQQNLLLDIAEKNKADIEALPRMSRPLWISGAGGPGAGKSTALIQFVARLFGADTKGLSQQDWREPSLLKALRTVFKQIPAVWSGADRSGLLDLTEADGHAGTSTEHFYKTCRWASNFLANLSLSRAVAGRKNVIHDTTLSGFSNLPEARILCGYYTVAVPVAAPLEMRQQAADQRNATYFQSLTANVTKQDADFGNKLPQIIADADEVHLHWRDDVNGEARLAALVLDNAKIAIYDEEAFTKLCVLYPKMKDVYVLLVRDDELQSRIPQIICEQRVQTKREFAWPVEQVKGVGCSNGPQFG